MDEIIAKKFQEHPDEDGDERWSRDMKLCPKDIHLVREALCRRRPDHTNNDATAVLIWTHQNPQSVILYQPQKTDICEPFHLVWSTPWQQKKLATFGDGSAIAIDATFGTNMYGISCPIEAPLLDSYSRMMPS